MAAIQKPIAGPAQRHPGAWVFAVVAGLFFFVSFIKFGNPIVLDRIVEPPENAQAAIFESWQVKWGYRLMVPLVLAGLFAVPWRKLNFKWPLALPLVWLAWQFIANTHTVSSGLSRVTLEHFSACVILFYLGCFALKEIRNPWPVWAGLALGLCWVIRAGFEQHFGGLEATRRLIQQMQDGADLPQGIINDPDFQRRIAKARIFATFSGPDAFAGGIELLLPLTLVFLWQITPKVRTAVRWLFVAILGGCGLACLSWSGSKAGWLVTVIIGLMAFGHSTLPVKWKRILICGLLVLGVAGFTAKYWSSFKRQNVSVTTRFAYWRAAIEITGIHPLLGTGPGTFSVPYRQVKQPADDFAHLCHNDYIEQASDSGIPGFLAYGTMMAGYILWLYRYRVKKTTGFDVEVGIWLGLFGILLHSIVEYHLYIPALAWPLFFLFGFLMNSNELTLQSIVLSRFYTKNR